MRLAKPNAASKLSLTLAALAAVIAWTSPAAAQSWPVKPIKLVQGFAAGGNGDIIARLVAQNITGPLGQALVETLPRISSPNRQPMATPSFCSPVGMRFRRPSTGNYHSIPLMISQWFRWCRSLRSSLPPRRTLP